jgi:hypothetical protein
MLVYFMSIRSIFRPFGIFYGHLAYFTPFWYIFTRVGMLYQEKSGNPGTNTLTGYFDAIIATLMHIPNLQTVPTFRIFAPFLTQTN